MLNEKICSISLLIERVLRFVYKDKKAAADGMIQRHGSVTLLHRNLQFLETQTFNVKNDLASDIIKEVLKSVYIMYVAK